MSNTITIQRLPPAGDATAGEEIVTLPMTAHDRRRVRRLVGLPDGTQLALELATGTVLLPGQVLHRDGARAYVVAAAPEDVVVIRPRDIGEAARVGHLIGNLHRDLEVDGEQVVALSDPSLLDRLRRAGMPVQEERRAFHGRAPGEHAH